MCYDSNNPHKYLFQTEAEEGGQKAYTRHFQHYSWDGEIADDLISAILCILCTSYLVLAGRFKSYSEIQ
jgi:hypothetical protein